MSEIGFFLRIVFLKKTRGSSPRVRGLRRPGPPWTGGHCRSQELAGAQPPAAPVPESSDRGAGELNGGVAAAREAVEGRLTGGGASVSGGRRRGRGEG
jgi:hypothetical protein